MEIIYEYQNERYTFKELLENFNYLNKAVTITYGDVCENHIGMQKLGKETCRGFSKKELLDAKARFEKLGNKCEYHDLNEFLPTEYKRDGDASVLIIRKGADTILKRIKKNSADFLMEQLCLEWDTTIYSVKHKNGPSGGVVNKNARWNLCYSDESQKADIVNGKGTVVAFDDVPCAKEIKDTMHKFLGDIAKNLKAEGNLYYDCKKTGIGWHGDAERNLVVAVRLGCSMPLKYNWFTGNKPIGNIIKFKLWRYLYYE
jgi:hypothetical protein